MDYFEEISLESRKSQGAQVVMGEIAGKETREEEEKMRGDSNQKGKRRRWKPK